jgi:hypothetical protein
MFEDVAMGHLQKPALLLLLTSVTAGVGAVAWAETRTWTDNTGKHTIEASFVEIVEGRVKLQRTDGKRVSLPLSRLSKGDQEYLQQLMKNRRGDPTRENDPFQEEPALPGAAAGGVGMLPPMPHLSGGRGLRAMRDRLLDQDTPQYQVGDKVEVREFGRWQVGEVVGFSSRGSTTYVKLESGEMVDVIAGFSIRPYDPTLGPLAGVKDHELARVDLTRIRRVVPVGSPASNFKPDGGAAVEPAWTPRPVGLNPRSEFFSQVIGVSFASGGTTAVVGHADRRGSDEGTLSKIEVCDLKSGQVTALIDGPRGLVQFAVSPSGRRLITLSEEDFFVSGPVQLWELSGDKLTHVTSWRASSGEGNQQVKWVGWVDDEHVMTVDGGTLTLWSTHGPKGAYQISGTGLGAPAFSPGRKQFAIGTDKGFSIHDVASGELLTRINMAPGFNRQVAFSPSGRLLAATASATIEIYDLETGEKAIEAYAPSADSEKGICWLDEEHVLAGGADLIHLPSQMVVWRYEHDAERVVQIAGKVWYVFHEMASGTMAMLPFDLPHPAVKPVRDSELVLKPGDEVSVHTEVMFDMARDVDGEVAATPIEQLKSALLAAGYLVVPESNKQLIGRTSQGETKEVAYELIGRPFDEPLTGTYTQQALELELVVDGEAVWKRQRVMDAPHRLRLKPAETVSEAVQRVLMEDNGFFRSTIPSRMLPTAAEKQRTSRLSMHGME